MNAKIFLWPCRQQAPSLPIEQIHVWAWDLDLAPSAMEWKTLNEEETLRARRFVFPRDRDRYVRAHSVMRRLLGNYAGIAPDEILFKATVYGKPALQQISGEPLRFNLSHSAGIAVLAVARNYKLGIDIEAMRPIDADVAEHHFSARELLILQDLPADSWLAGFYRCWTSKEALLKGEGLGLNLSLTSFDVEADPLRPPALLATRSPARLASGWTLFELRPISEALGALAVQTGSAAIAANAIQYFALNG